MTFLDERFSSDVFDPRLTWTNPPPRVARTDRGLEVHTARDTDLWQRTHYGFRKSDAHGLLATVPGDFTLETVALFEPQHQYDQAGLLVWISPECWLKTSIEFEPEGPCRLGSVVTNAGWSDWATQDIDRSTRSARYRVTRHAGDYTVEYGDAAGNWSQLRIAHLAEDDGAHPLRAGLYACSPKEAGLRVWFEFLRIDTR